MSSRGEGRKGGGLYWEGSFPSLPLLFLVSLVPFYKWGEGIGASGMAGEGSIAFGSIMFPSLTSLPANLSPCLVLHFPCGTSVPSGTFSRKHVPIPSWWEVRRWDT